MDLTAVDHVLTTTRAVRKRLDLTRPVERDVIARCIDIAIQAPTGSNRQGWHFLVITDANHRAQIGKLYKKSFAEYASTPPRQRLSWRMTRDDVAQLRRVSESAVYLADHMHQVPIMIIPCIEGRAENAGPMAQASLYGSILPATWSLMLALRSRGLGSAWTTLHLRYEQQIAALLGIPDDITQAALLPVAYFTGDDFRPAKRRPAREFTYWDAWDRRQSSSPAP